MKDQLWQGFRFIRGGEAPGGQSAPDSAADPETTAVHRITAARTTAAPRQLTSLDHQLLDADIATTPLHIGVLAVLDTPAAAAPLTVAALRQLFAARLHLVPALRWRLRTVPFGVDRPYWEDCATVDLACHVREVRLQSADEDGDEELGELIARLHEAPLDRGRPLWECALVSGLPGGRQALYAKVHHAVIDGVSAAEVLAAIFDISPEYRELHVPAEGVRLHHTPGAVEMIARSVGTVVGRQTERVRTPARVAPTLWRALADLRKKHPEVPFNATNTARRSVAYTSLPLAPLKEIKRSVDGTINDVVMALCTSALRRWLADHDVDTGTPLLAAVPVSVRTTEQLGTAGNQFSVMLCELPIGEPDPQHRLKLLHANLLEAKQKFRAGTPTVLHQAAGLLPSIAHGAATRALLRVAAPALPLANLIISNVPGPQLPLYAGGIPVLASYPISVLTDLSGGLNITAISYDGHLDVGIVACADSVPDVWDLARYLHHALAELRY
ncbi:WS/DGAT/MGAT family O-acyltransferase [Nocardia sp. alder85J]|uniref:WS/DGAT/MGAT family O-acyltransferase n=1 Tax=Nocardia sp. alder85J TaxID=2862949 RepID=UPI001CD806BC|nr:wax ester/triacylglycerol synthase family O-acyltransferase [Nocardia sp. alder85J]MCX4094380.1 wax ester/triacylglycerol synthase family O-acyltransferase [Nocardia sp. alder85J]